MDQVAEVREKLDIAQLISEFVTLKRAGRNFKANCPFHQEKSPSFVVSPERQIWHCFGCGKGGDCFTFLMEYERVEFPEALRILAKRVGVTLKQTGFDAGVGSKKEKIYQINRLAAEFYHYVLTKHTAGKKALSYLKERGVSEKVLKSFLIGFAPAQPRALTDYLMKKKQVTRDELYEAGLITTRGREVLDFFYGRIMFPLFDARENVAGFSGRILESVSDSKAKYINTRDTLVYHKGEQFFGLHMTKDAIRRENQAILVEGEFDVLSCFQEGVANVAGVKGTALTEKQVNLLSRYAEKITVCFDGDKAGREAIKRSLPILERKNLQTSVVVIPGGMDPDEAIKKDAVAFKKAVKEDMNIYEYLLMQLLKEYDSGSAEGKGKIADYLLPIFSKIGNEVIKEHYLRKLSTELSTSYESLQKQALRLQGKEPPSVLLPQTKQKRDREELLEEYLLSLITQSEKPKEAVTHSFAILDSSVDSERAHQKILLALQEYFTKQDSFDGKVFGGSLPSELQETYDKALLFPLASFEEGVEEREIEKTAVQLRELYVKRKMKRLSETIRVKERAGEETEAAELKEQFSRLVSLLEK